MQTKTVNQIGLLFFLCLKTERRTYGRIIKELPHKQLILNIGKTKYTVNLHFKQGTWET